MQTQPQRASPSVDLKSATIDAERARGLKLLQDTRVMRRELRKLEQEPETKALMERLGQTQSVARFPEIIMSSGSCIPGLQSATIGHFMICLTPGGFQLIHAGHRYYRPGVPGGDCDHFRYIYGVERVPADREGLPILEKPSTWKSIKAYFGRIPTTYAIPVRGLSCLVRDGVTIEKVREAVKKELANPPKYPFPWEDEY